jgi:hypothetical protein
MTKPNWIFCSTKDCEHEAQHAGRCRWCYDIEYHRKRNLTTSKVSLSEENEILDAIESAGSKVQLRTIEKGLKE